MTGLVACVLLRRVKDEYSLLISLSVSVMVLFATLKMSGPVIEYIEYLSDTYDYSEYIGIVVKCCVVAVVCGFASEIASDCNENGIASKIVMIGKCTIMMYSLPLLKAIIDMARSFV